MKRSTSNTGLWLTKIACIVIAVAFVTTALAEQAAPQLIPASAVNQAQKAAAQKAVHDVLTAWKAGSYTPLSNAFTAEVKTALPPEKQRQSYTQMKALFGDYQSMAFAEAYNFAQKGQNYVIYRFRGNFTGTTDRPEIRITMDSSGKVAGFYARPWLKVLM